VLSAACELPSATRTFEEICAEEGVAPSTDLSRRLGVERVHVCVDEKGTELALRAARRAMELGGVLPAEIDVIVDYTVLPQEYLVPAWSMSNKLQHELQATKAFTVGFSGGGTTNLSVALHLAASLIRSDAKITTCLLLAADVALPHNRVLNPDTPMTVLGDGASAIVLRRGASGTRVVTTELWSDGRLHDVCYIPGGAMAHPDRLDLCTLRIDREKLAGSRRTEVLREMAERMLAREGLAISDVAYFLYPNFSAEDQAAFVETFGVPEGRIDRSTRVGHGHVQANDLVLNYLAATEAGAIRPGDAVLVASHGLGFSWGVTLLRH
jgi:3-oxoacyl-[acyl-carrier-protein] synthase-3